MDLVIPMACILKPVSHIRPVSEQQPPYGSLLIISLPSLDQHTPTHSTNKMGCQCPMKTQLHQKYLPYRLASLVVMQLSTGSWALMARSKISLDQMDTQNNCLLTPNTQMRMTRQWH